MRKLTTILLAATLSAALLEEHPEIAQFPEVQDHCLRNGTEWIEASPENGGLGSAECYADWVRLRREVSPPEDLGRGAE